jgi:hypothetical protein
VPERDRRSRMPRCLMAALSCVLLAAGFSADAGASVPAAPLRSGPVLTSDGVAWAETAPGGDPSSGFAGYVVRSATSGGGSGVRIVVPGERIGPELHASSELLAVGQARTSLGDGRYIVPVAEPSDTRTWSLDGTPLAQFGACGSRVGQEGGMELIGVAGHDIATCDQAAINVLIADGRTGQTIEEIPAAAHVRSVRLAGPFVAWLEHGTDAPGFFTLVVFDRATRTEVLRTPTTTFGDTFADWDLRDDGTVAYAVGNELTSSDRRQRIGWTSPTAPTAHPLPVRPSFRYSVRVIPGGVAFRRVGPRSRLQLALAPLDGTPARLLADGVSGAFDADATRLAFAYPGCQNATIEIRALTAPVFTAPVLSHCWLRLRRAPRQAPVAGTVQIALACDTLPFACEGPVQLTLPRPGRRALLLARATVTSGEATLHLRAVARRLLHEHGGLAARLTVSISPVDTTRPLQYTRTVGLRAD